jgi:putative membrane protein
VSVVRRLLSSRKMMRENAHNAACAAFVRLGVSRTSGRNGILVFVSTFEKMVEIVCDVGVDATALGEPWAKGLAGVERCVSGRIDFEGFVQALEALGPIIGEAMPHMADDVNELPDDVDAA